MAVYPDAISGSLDRLKYFGNVGSAVSGRGVNFNCGGFVEILLKIDDDSAVVAAARFRSNGCGYMVAAAEAVCSELDGAELAGLHGLEHIGDTLAEQFGSISAARAGCLDAVIGAVKGAFREHREQVVAEFAGEKALVCTCFGVSEDTILTFIAAEGPATAQEISDACRAGSGCGSCRMILQELIDSAERERLMTGS